MSLGRIRPVAGNLTALSAVAVLLSGDGASSLPGTGARLAERLKALTGREIQERLAAEGIEVTADFAAQLQLDAVQQLEDSEAAALQTNDEHAAAPVDGNDGANGHSRTLGEQERGTA